MAGVGIGLHRVDSKLNSPREGGRLTADLHEPAIARSKAYLPSMNGVEHGEARGRHCTVARLAVAALAERGSGASIAGSPFVAPL